ncbi:hypothetical protein B1F79_02940 [Coxiella-like endosymbiont of Rhipicephalus sanguineus]|nr:hypothetical protein [Coxiella-like endosymbiont of Rhipicephalus sanguineus]
MIYYLSVKDSSLELETRDDGFFVQNVEVAKSLNYPLNPLQCRPSQTPTILLYSVRCMVI